MSNNKHSFRNLLNKFSVTKNAKYFAIVPLVIVLIALIMIISIGETTGSYSNAVGIGIDFEGGTVLDVVLGEDGLGENFEHHRTQIIEAIEKNGVEVTYVQQQRAGNVENSSISFRYKNIDKDDEAIKTRNDKIKDDVAALYAPDPDDADAKEIDIRYQSIGATAARDLLSKSGIALAVSVVLILIYIIIRFTLMSGFAAIIALLHDVVIMFALTVICRVQINSSYVAAMITIIAYSINNTIIIFDRCRESLKPIKHEKNIDYAGIGDMAVRDTFTRSVYTTFTTMVTVIFLAILGSDSVREFCVPIILGLLAGMFSSVCLAAPLWAAMSTSFDQTKAKHLKGGVTYGKKEDKDEEGEEQIINTNTVRPNAPVKKAGQKPQQKKVVYKYKKKNTKFKK